MSEEETRLSRATFHADDRGALKPSNLAEAIEFAKLLAASDFVPAAYQGKAGNILAAVQMGAEVGLAPMQALQNIAVINGRPSVWGDAALALCRTHPEWGGIEESDDGEVATCTVWRYERAPGGRVKRESSATFSMDDAKRAGLAGKKGPWQDYPRRMRQMRARSFALRDAFADALRGLSVREEVMDYVDVTAEVVEEKPRVKQRGAEAVRQKLVARELPPDEQPNETVQHMLTAYAECSDAATLKSLETVRAADWAKFGKSDKEALKAASDAAKARVQGGE